jgi:hypothetical protein
MYLSQIDLGLRWINLVRSQAKAQTHDGQSDATFSDWALWQWFGLLTSMVGIETPLVWQKGGRFAWKPRWASFGCTDEYLFSDRRWFKPHEVKLAQIWKLLKNFSRG